MKLSYTQLKILRLLCSDADEYIMAFNGHLNFVASATIRGKEIPMPTFKALVKYGLIEHDKKTCVHPRSQGKSLIDCYGPTRKGVASVFLYTSRTLDVTDQKNFNWLHSKRKRVKRATAR